MRLLRMIRRNACKRGMKRGIDGMKTETASVLQIAEEASQRALALAAAKIRAGGLVVFPTETVYGLGGNAMDPEAAGKIYAAKGRPADNPLIVHVASPEEADAFAETNDVYFRIARAFMPGPITVILPAKACLPRTVTAGLETVAVRCPAHPVARALIRIAKTPICGRLFYPVVTYCYDALLQKSLRRIIFIM